MRKSLFWTLGSLLFMQSTLLAEPQGQDLDPAVRETLRRLIARLDGDGFQDRQAAQRELERFLDDDAKATFVRTYCAKGGADRREGGRLAVHAYEVKKNGRIAGMLYAGPTHVPGEIWVMDFDGLDAKRLAQGNIADLWWSPDGKRLAFEVSSGGLANRRNGTDYYVADVESGVVTKVVAHREGFRRQRGLSWSYDGTKLAYLHAPQDEGFDLYTVNPDGTQRRRIASGVSEVFCWSSRATRVFYGGWLSQHGTSRWTLRSIDADGQDAKEIASWPSGLVVTCSPMSEVLAVVADEGMNRNSSGLYLISLAEGRKTLLQKGVNDVFSWSPDGTKILVQRGSGTRDWQRCKRDKSVIDLESKKEIKLPAKLDPFGPLSWSPDATRLFYRSDEGEPFKGVIVDLETDPPHLLKKFSFQSSRAAPKGMVWSPDSKYLVYAIARQLPRQADRTPGVPGGTFVVDRNGRNPKKISPKAFRVVRWSPSPSCAKSQPTEDSAPFAARNH